MASKGIPTRPLAKRINKLPLTILVSVLFIIVVACFYVVTKKQNKLQKTIASGPVMETAPINTDTQTPDFLETTYLQNLDEETRKDQKAKKLSQNKTDQQEGRVQISEVDPKEVNPKVVKKDPKSPGKARESLEKPFQPYYQANQPPPVEPKKSDAEIFREKVISQKREAALKALRAPTIVSIGSASSLIPQAVSKEAFSRNGQYQPPPAMIIPPQEKADQTQKKDFLATAEEGKVSLANAYSEANSPFEIKQGHLIPITLITKINSDLPGRIKAQVTENVYDTATGNYLLIPQGTMVNGIYDSRIVFGQKRILIAWQRLIFPDGSALNVGSMPGTDREGTAGLSDLVNNHYLQIFGGAILMSVVNAGFTIATDTAENEDYVESAQDSISKSVAQEMQQVFSRMIDKIMSIQPELIIRQGKQGHIILTKDIIGLKPYNPAQKPTYFLKTAKVN